MDASDVIQLIILVVLLLLSAFFSSAETAFMTVNKVKIKTLADENKRSALILLKVLESPGKFLSTILIGNNVVNISATSLATSLAINSWGIAVGIVTGILTIIILLFGEITPKTWATFHSEKISLSYAPFIYGLMYVMTPIVFLVDKLSSFFLRLLGIKPGAKTSYMTESELKTYVDVSHEDGVIESEEREMILNVFDLGDSLARDIMIPRVGMTIADVNSSHREILNIFKNTMYSRIPIYEEDTDNIIGIITMKDFFITAKKTDFSVREILRAPYYTYEHKKTDDLLIEMRENAINIAIVLDEYGAAVGLITLEDLLEEIVGEIRDEYDEEEKELIQEIEPRTYLVEGSMKIDDINNALCIDLNSDDYDSIGGILIEKLDSLPAKGDEVTLDNGIRLIATSLNKNRIQKITLILPEVPSTDDEEENTESTSSIPEGIEL